MAHAEFSKYSFFPIQHPNILAFYRRQFDMLWTAQEVDFSADRGDWVTLDESTQKMLKFVLCFFSQADGLVIENIAHRFQAETSELVKEAGHFYIVQNLVETVHNEIYSVMIDVFITDRKERARALNAVANYPSIRTMATWIKRWMESSRPLSERIIAFACVEGIVFVAFFVLIWFIKRKNKLPGLCKANEFIARDEALHTLFAVELYHTLVASSKEHELDEKTAKCILKEAVNLAIELVEAALPVDFIGLSAEDLGEYVRVAADNLAVQLGFSPVFEATNPFDWMIAIGLPNRTNFFEQRVTEYSKLSVEANRSLEFDIQSTF